MLPFTVELVDDDAAVTAYAGLPLMVETMRKGAVVMKLGRGANELADFVDSRLRLARLRAA
jgi:hypothetical protein